MDLLRTAYSPASDDDGEEHEMPSQPSLPKRPRINFYPLSPAKAFTPPIPPIPTHPPLIAGRYVSKREKAALAAVTTSPESTSPSTVSISPGSISDSDLPRDIINLVRNQGKSHMRLGEMPERLTVGLNGHSKCVNVVEWSETHAHLLASAGMDHTISIWNVWSRNNKKARVFSNHSAAIKDVKWSKNGLSILSCGYDCSTRLTDVDKGLETQIFKEDQVVDVIRYHPENSNLFLSGGSKGLISLWDIRLGERVHQYKRGLGPILDLEFNTDTKQFISSTDISRSRISENSIIVWDITREIPLSNQVYGEAYTCPCIRRHPLESYFVAQSNGNYIAIFSSRPPFKLDKYKRYEGHGISGFPIKCNFNMKGDILASGSSDGCLYLYNSKSSRLVKKIKAYEQACIDVSFHPVIPNVIASCSWNGDVSVFE